MEPPSCRLSYIIILRIRRQFKVRLVIGFNSYIITGKPVNKIIGGVDYEFGVQGYYQNKTAIFPHPLPAAGRGSLSKQSRIAL